MEFISFPGGAEWLIIALALLWPVLLIYTVLGIWKRNDIEDSIKLLWTIFIVIAPFLGLIIYLVAGKRPVTANNA